MLIVPVKAVPNQTLAVLLANQSCTINLRTQSTGLYMDLFVSNQPIIEGVICQNYRRIVRSLYLGFIGDFLFADQQSYFDVNGIALGTDPVFTGLGSQYLLQYIEASELPSGVG